MTTLCIADLPRAERQEAAIQVMMAARTLKHKNPQAGRWRPAG